MTSLKSHFVGHSSSFLELIPSNHNAQRENVPRATPLTTSTRCSSGTKRKLNICTHGQTMKFFESALPYVLLSFSRGSLPSSTAIVERKTNRFVGAKRNWSAVTFARISTFGRVGMRTCFWRRENHFVAAGPKIAGVGVLARRVVKGGPGIKDKREKHLRRRRTCDLSATDHDSEVPLAPPRVAPSCLRLRRESVLPYASPSAFAVHGISHHAQLGPPLYNGSLINLLRYARF